MQKLLKYGIVPLYREREIQRERPSKEETKIIVSTADLENACAIAGNKKRNLRI